MSERIPCVECGALILPSTAQRTQGRCMPCKGGYREEIDAGRAENAAWREEQKRWDEAPAGRHWHGLIERIYRTEAGFSGVSEPEQQYFAVTVLSNEIHNGGFHQYFHNSSADRYQQARAGLQEIGALHTLELLERAKRIIFGEGDVPDTQTGRWPAVLACDRAANAELDRLDTAFYANDEVTAEKLEAFAQRWNLY